MGSERISAKNGTALLLGRFPATLLASPSEMPNLNVQDIRNQSNETVTNAEKEVTNVHDILDVQAPPMSSIVETDKANYSHTGPLDCYYFHPDHLGSSSYITNLAGNVSQHMEYLPFGETLVDEHLNSRNSPFKYNGKEFDEETGNYYYGARYYDPKWSIWMSVDKMAEKYHSYSPYNYALNNPVNLIDPDGNSPNDHIFDSKGNFIIDTGVGNKIIIEVGSKCVTPSQLDISKQGTKQTLANITNYYLKEKGFSGRAGVASNTEGAYYDPNKDGIYTGLKSFKNMSFDNYNHLKSALNHEIGHQAEGDLLADYNFLAHANIYKLEASHPDFDKTESFYKAGNACHYVTRILNGIENNEIINIDDAINSYNKTNSDVQIQNLSTRKNLDGTRDVFYNVKVGNEIYDGKPYEKLKGPSE